MTDEERLAWMVERQAVALETIAEELKAIRVEMTRQPAPVPLENWPISDRVDIHCTGSAGKSYDGVL